MNIQDQLTLMQKSIEELKMILLKNQLNIISDKWISWSDAKNFFDYGATQMSILEKNNHLIVTKVGKRKYIHRDSIIKLLEKNIIK
jgi:hypothetical protein